MTNWRNELRTASETLRRIPFSLLTTDELALYLRCHRRTIERLVQRGTLQPIFVGRCWRFDRESVLDALRPTAGG